MSIFSILTAALAATLGFLLGDRTARRAARSEIADERDRADALDAALNAQGGASPSPDAEPNR